MLTEQEGSEPPPRSRKHIADGPRVAMPARMRWAWTVVFEVGLVAIMLSSDARWLVRVVVIVVGTVLMASIHAYWREYGMPGNGTP